VVSRKNILHIHEKHAHLTEIMYLRYLVKMKQHISYYYVALLEYCPLHQAWCETKFIKYRENKLTVTRYVQNVQH